MPKVRGVNVKAEQKQFAKEQAAKKHEFDLRWSLNEHERITLLIEACEAKYRGDIASKYSKEELQMAIHSWRVDLGRIERSRLYKEALKTKQL